MLRTIVIGSVAAAFVLALAGDAAAQRGGGQRGGGGRGDGGGLYGRKACERGMPHAVCVDRCVELGGVGRGPPNPLCAHRCTKLGCVDGGKQHRPH